MPLHRDIHWIGRQWAVTGHGLQLIDQKQQGVFDIEVSKLWDDDLIDSIHAKEWLNAADFYKGLTIAQTFVAQHNGSIEWSSAPGSTVFTIVIPLELTRAIP